MPRLCLALLFVTATGAAFSATATVEARFGRVEVDTTRPGLASLVLRAPGGMLEPRSVLAPIGAPWPRGVAGWGEGGYTYVVDAAGVRYESRNAPPRSVVRSADRVVLDGVALTAGSGQPPAALERWVVSAQPNGVLSWTVERRWLREFTARLAGTPALFSSFRRCTDSDLLPNSVTHTLWVQPDRLTSWFEPLYRAWPADYKMALDNCAVVSCPDTWAVAKLWTSWHAQSDLRLSVRGGHLYRRGFFGWRAELGAVSSPHLPRRYRAGERERVTLTVRPVDKRSTGYQLQAGIPDKAVEQTLGSFYGSLLNGGVVNDQKHYDFGNETDGWYYDGSTWMQGLALAAGAPAPGRLATSPYDVATAFRQHLAAIVGTVGPDGVGNFGYDWTGSFPDARLNNVIGAREYLLHSGDLAFVRQVLPDLERGVGWFLARRNAHGLVDLGPAGHWYYDAMPTSGVNANHNALLYRACQCMAEMESAAGKPEASRMYARIAAQLKAAFNAALWNEGAPGGPRITDWIAHDGEKVTYAADVCQFPAVAFGMLPRDRARALLATIDGRIGELERTYGYTGMASLSAYWPVPDRINTLPWQRAFPIYMNCGSFLGITYYEIMARIEAGDVEGAWERMRRFSQGVARHSGAGNNWVTVRGEVAAGADEPYLSDMVVVPAALVRGFLGVEPTWDRLVVRPHLPAGWRNATAQIVYKGVLQRIVIDGERVTVTPVRRVLTPPALLTWEVRPAAPPEWQMTVSRHFGNGATPPVSDGVTVDGGQHVALNRERPAGGLLGRWTMERAPAAGVVGAVAFGQAGPRVGSAAAVFAGQGFVNVPDPEWYRFPPRQSFTLQCWFRTDARDSRVMVSRPEAYCLYMKDGKLAAWAMQTDHQFREALGSTQAADDAWHHAAAVYDRTTDHLSLYLDGKLDTPDGRPCAANPVSIAPVGASGSRAPLYIGGLGTGFPFVGSLAEVTVHAGALLPAAMAYPLPRVERVAVPTLAPRGTYVSSLCDWGQEAALRVLVVESTTNGGSVAAVVECSQDRFRTVSQRAAFLLRGGREALPLRLRSARYARVRLTLAADRERRRTPVVRYLLLRARPPYGERR